MTYCSNAYYLLCDIADNPVQLGWSGQTCHKNNKNITFIEWTCADITYKPHLYTVPTWVLCPDPVHVLTVPTLPEMCLHIVLKCVCYPSTVPAL